MKIGFIGIGVMGNGMVHNLMKKGHTVQVYTRTKSKADEAVKDGAVWCDTIARCIEGVDTVITMVGYPKDVEEVYFGENGIFRAAQPGQCLIDMTTTSPKLAKRIYDEAKNHGLMALDAPVSGGDTGAKNGTLAIMVGGDELVFEKSKPMLSAMGTSVTFLGVAGSGQHTKMANQIAIAGAVAGVAEAMAYAYTAGLDTEKVLSTISAGAAGSWQMSYNGPKMIKGDFSAGFFLKHFVKDMNIAIEEASDRDMDLPVLNTVREIYHYLEESGCGDEGTQAIIKAYLDPQ